MYMIESSSAMRRTPMVVVAALTALMLSGLLSATASAAPTNTALPAVSPTAPKVGQTVSTTNGTWNSASSAHWFEGATQLPEGKSTAVTVSNAPITFAGTIYGYPGAVTCQTSINTGAGASLENPTGGGSGKGSAELEYKNCMASPEWEKLGCAASSGDKTPISVELSTIEGQAKVKLSSTSGVLGSISLWNCSAGSELTGTYKLVGVINGFVSNGGSQIEFNPTTTATGLRFKSAAGPKATATGTIGLKGTGGASIKADAITYTYAWKHCAACTPILGATGPTYTPTAGDAGSSLIVAVTATDSSGSTTVESSPTGGVQYALSWYVCGKWGGAGQYEDDKCSKSGGSNEYSWSRQISAPFTATNVAFGESQSYHLWIEVGSGFHIRCTASSGGGTLSSTETQAKLEGFALTLSGCAAVESGGCQLSSTTIKFNTLKASSPLASTLVPKKELLVEPSSGTELAEFGITNCGSLNGTYKIVGSFPAQMLNEGSLFYTEWREVYESERMHVQTPLGASAHIGTESTTSILGEGGKPIKLDVTQ